MELLPKFGGVCSAKNFATTASADSFVAGGFAMDCEDAIGMAGGLQYGDADAFEEEVEGRDGSVVVGGAIDADSLDGTEVRLGERSSWDASAGLSASAGVGAVVFPAKSESKRRWKMLDRRLKKVEAVLDQLVNGEKGNVSGDSRGISKATFLQTITKAINSEAYPCGVSKIYIKKCVSQELCVDLSSQHYSKKLNSLLQVGIKEKLFLYDNEDGLFKML